MEFLQFFMWIMFFCYDFFMYLKFVYVVDEYNKKNNGDDVWN